MNKFGVKTQRWGLVSRENFGAAQVEAAAPKGAEEYVVKAQIHAGGRGKGTFNTGFKGGVHLAKDVGKVTELTGKMLGNRLVTKQTPPNGVEVQKVLLCEAVNFTEEKYFALLLDRASAGPVMVGSPAGGMDIEEVAEKTPHLIYRQNIALSGPTPQQALDMATKLGFKDTTQAAEQIQNLYKLFSGTDSTQVEINPMVETTKGDVICVDAKINFDDNAAYRQKNIWEYRDTGEEDPREVAASKFDLNYIGMDGNIGCMVNGAGLAMSTMDIIHLYGQSPANFLDVGGSANTTQITEAFKIISSDPQVQVILVNIFGGIMKCDTIANGVVSALKNIPDLKQPIVCRLSGTNVDLGYQILKDSGFKIETAVDLDEAAKKASAAAEKLTKL